METFEFKGKTAEEAIEKACRELNKPKDLMDIEILEPGSAGIFGLVGGRKAKIKVTLEETQPQAQEDDSAGSAPGVEAGNGLATAKESLEKILELMPVEGVLVRASHTDGTILLNIEGDKSGLLIGRKGRTLDALQFIVNKIVNKTLERRTQVVLDSENYRARRRDFLIQMALKLGDKAKKTTRPVATNPLNPHDRRIVHLALKDDDKLDTKSRGDGVLKKVIILPRRNS